jgi:hypothetical protein
MNNKIFMVLLLMFSGAAAAYAQNNLPIIAPPPATRLENFAARKNATIATETYFVARVPADNGCSIQLQALILYESGRETEQVRGLRVEVTETQRSKEERTAVSYVDLDEFDSLTRGLNSMLDMTQRGTFLANPVSKEMSITTRGGLILAMVQRDTERQLRITNALQPDSICVITREASIVELKTSIEKVLQSFK